MRLLQENMTFQHQAPASAFVSTEFSDNFFKDTTCFRKDQSLCYEEGHKYYEVRHGMISKCIAGRGEGGEEEGREGSLTWPPVLRGALVNSGGGDTRA